MTTGANGLSMRSVLLDSIALMISRPWRGSKKGGKCAITVGKLYISQNPMSSSTTGNALSKSNYRLTHYSLQGRAYLNDLSKDDVLSVEPRGLGSADEELRSCGGVGMLDRES